MPRISTESSAQISLKDLKAPYRQINSVLKDVSALEAHSLDAALYGSARIKDPNHPSFIAAKAIAQMLAEENFHIITGGGPAIMQAANEGARAGAQVSKTISVGAGISIPHEVLNPFLDVGVTLQTFDTRIALFKAFGDLHICLTGGLGTFLEQMSVLAHLQERKLGISKIVPAANHPTRPIPELIMVGQHFQYFPEMVKELTALGVNGEYFCGTSFLDGSIEVAANRANEHIRARAKTLRAEIANNPGTLEGAAFSEHLKTLVQRLEREDLAFAKQLDNAASFFPNSRTRRPNIFTTLICGGEGLSPNSDLFPQARDLAFDLTLSRYRVISHGSEEMKKFVDEGHRRGIEALSRNEEKVPDWLRLPPSEYLFIPKALDTAEIRPRILSAFANSFVFLPGDSRTISDAAYVLQHLQFVTNARTKDLPTGLKFATPAMRDFGHVPTLVLSEEGWRFMRTLRDCCVQSGTATRDEFRMVRANLSSGGGDAIHNDFRNYKWRLKSKGGGGKPENSIT